MQIIQSIREKGAVIVIVVIALSLIGFILMDARQGGNGMNQDTVIGTVNGKEILGQVYDERAKMQEQQYGQSRTGLESYYAREQAWYQILEEMLTRSESDKLGITVTDKEVSDLLMSNDPNNPLLQNPQFKDSLTGKLDLKKAQAQITQMKTLKGEQREELNKSLDMIKEGLYRYKYSSLITGSAYYPDWMQKNDQKASTAFATVNFVMVPFSDITDSAVKVTDAAINDYVKKNPAKFKVEENQRKISYLAFSQKASRNDSNLVYNELLNTRSAFLADSSKSPAAFVANAGSATPYRDTFIQKSALPMIIVKDTTSGQLIGRVFGPYIQGNSYALAKVLDSKMMPDSAKARHILFQTADPRNPNNNTLMPDAQAKKMADSVLLMLQAGANFDTLCQTYSYDLGSKAKGGDLGYFSSASMVPEFSAFCFNKTIGERGVVKTEYGYHVIEVTGQKNPNAAYKMAFITKEINTSEETINRAGDLANKASESKDKQSLVAFGKQNGVEIVAVSAGLKESDFMINSLPNLDCREVVKWANGAATGSVSPRFSIGDQYVVAVLEKVLNKGELMDAETARPTCEFQVRNNLKFTMLKAKAGGANSLEAIAAAYAKSITNTGADSTLTFNAQSFNGTYEPKVIGAAFRKDALNKLSSAIQGENALYFIQVVATGSKPAPPAFEAEQTAKTKANDTRNAISRWIDGLRKQAEIVDERSKYY
jgi:peptidyl-prolyl cis-trans isomerase D